MDVSECKCAFCNAKLTAKVDNFQHPLILNNPNPNKVPFRFCTSSCLNSYLKKYANNKASLNIDIPAKKTDFSVNK